MKEPHVEGLAIHDDPESCAIIREGAGEALTGAPAGWVLSREKSLQGADAVEIVGRRNGMHRHGEVHAGPARSETPRTPLGNLLHGKREIPGDPAGASPCSRMLSETAAKLS